MSTYAAESRDYILERFHEITHLNIEECIQCLDHYNWKLQDIIEDYYNGKDLKNKCDQTTTKKIEKAYLQSNSSDNPNFGNSYMSHSQKQQIVEDDLYYAQLLHNYGDSDELARKCGGEMRDNRERQPQKQPKSNISTKNVSIYHEKQQYLRCGIHSLNNLFQIPQLFTQEHLDSIVRKFDKRSIHNDYGKLWIGDYDLRVLIEAISHYDFIVRQINFYNGEPLQCLPWDSYFGLLINLNGAHWFTIKNFNGIYYNLDSTFYKPCKIGLKDDLINYLIHLIQKFNSVYIFAVMNQTQRTHNS